MSTVDSSPHYSRAPRLQSLIHYCDKPSVGGLAPWTFSVLHEYASGPLGSAFHPSTGTLSMPKGGEPS